MRPVRSANPASNSPRLVRQAERAKALGGLRGPAAGGHALLVEPVSPTVGDGLREEGDPQIGEEGGVVGHEGVRLAKGRPQQRDALGAQRGFVQAFRGEAERRTEGGAVLGAVRAVPRREVHRLAQGGDRLPHLLLVPGHPGRTTAVPASPRTRVVRRANAGRFTLLMDERHRPRRCAVPGAVRVPRDGTAQLLAGDVSGQRSCSYAGRVRKSA